ncbi:MAG TPA: sugar phosphate isomerase/epimerase family protein [bacterium]|nr:sugar phosphate isomerase/epimerase family protein [bacterium]
MPVKRKVGVIVESFRKQVREGIHLASQLKLDGIQVYVTHGEMAPENLSKSGREEFLAFVRSQGLELSALCGDLGHGFVDPNKNQELIEKTKKMVDLCLDLSTPILSTHIGVIPEGAQHPVWQVLTEALEEIGAYAENRDCVLATETGPESTELMARFLGSLKTSAIKVNYDPANLAMNEFDPVKGVRDLGQRIVHTHAKDGLGPKNGGPKEVPLGEGDVPFKDYLAALDSIGFDGFLTIEREVGDDPVADITKARDFLRSL